MFDVDLELSRNSGNVIEEVHPTRRAAPLERQGQGSVMFTDDLGFCCLANATPAFLWPSQLKQGLYP